MGTKRAPRTTPHLGMQIFLRVRGQTQFVECTQSDHVALLHAMLPASTNGSEDFYLTHAGKCLSDPSATLGDCGVDAGSVVQALCRLNGAGHVGNVRVIAHNAKSARCDGQNGATTY